MNIQNFSRTNYERKRKLAFETLLPFPKQKLQNRNASNRLVLVSCGSFSPITYAHLRIFELARECAISNNMNVIGGYISPVGDVYKKKGLVEASHRVNMCELAVESSDWIMVDNWESLQTEYQTTLVVLDHIYYSLNKDIKENEEPIQVKLICGSDLLDSFNTPNVWDPEDISDILAKYGIFVLERLGSDPSSIIYNNDLLFKYTNRIQILKQWINNDISSTKLRQNLYRNLSIKYLTADSVINYIKQNQLFNTSN